MQASCCLQYFLQPCSEHVTTNPVVQLDMHSLQVHLYIHWVLPGDSGQLLKLHKMYTTDILQDFNLVDAGIDCLCIITGYCLQQMQCCVCVGGSLQSAASQWIHSEACQHLAAFPTHICTCQRHARVSDNSVEFLS